MTSLVEQDQSSAWKWLVLAASFIAMMVNPSLNYHVGVLNIAILDNFNFPFSATSWLLSLYSSMFALSAPLGSLVIFLTNCRTCVFLSGLVTLVGYVASSFARSFSMLFFALTLTGIGHSLALTGAVLILAYYFPNNVAVVNGICLAGSGMGSFVHPMLLQALLDSFGLQGALLLIGAISCHACAMGMVFRPTRFEAQKAVDSGDMTCSSFLESIKDKLSVLKEPVFVTFTLGVFCYAVCFHTIMVYLPEYVITVVGISKTQASMAASAMGMGSVMSRLFTGFAASDRRIGELLLFIGMSGLASIMCFCAGIILHHFASVMVFSAIMGLYTGGTFSLITPIVVDIVSVQHSNAGFGVAMMACGLGGFFGPPVAALFLQMFDFHVLFTICGTIFVTSSMLGMTTALLKSRRPIREAEGDLKRDSDLDECHDDKHVSELSRFIETSSHDVDSEL